MVELRRRTFTEAPTFGKSCQALPESRIVEFKVRNDDDDDDGHMNDFEFALTTAVAGEIFSKPVYPIFNQNLVGHRFESSEEKELVKSMGSGSASSSSSVYSEADELATPSSGLETLEFRRFRVRDLFFGCIRSDGKGRMVLPATKKEIERADFYGKGSAARRSFLPYRQELLGGFFGREKHQPF